MDPEGGRTIDLNFDGGEGYDDAAIAPFATTVNVACGGHAGDGESMRAAVRLAAGHGLAVAAHPSYPDRERFGRARLEMDAARLRDSIADQIATLVRIAAGEGARVSLVKPHGALYHAAAREAPVAEAVVLAVVDVDRRLVLVGPPTGRLLRDATGAGLATASEGFVDRRYLADGALVPRGEPGALLEDPEEAVRQAVALARDGRVETSGGAVVALNVRTLCLHGDTPGAASIAARVRMALESAGVRVRSLVPAEIA